jgi:hypothetical protein
MLSSGRSCENNLHDPTNPSHLFSVAPLIPVAVLQRELGISRERLKRLARLNGVELRLGYTINQVNYDTYVNQCKRKLAPISLAEAKRIIRAHYAEVGSRRSKAT